MYMVSCLSYMETPSPKAKTITFCGITHEKNKRTANHAPLNSEQRGEMAKLLLLLLGVLNRTDLF